MIISPTIAGPTARSSRSNGGIDSSGLTVNDPDVDQRVADGP